MVTLCSSVSSIVVIVKLGALKSKKGDRDKKSRWEMGLPQLPSLTVNVNNKPDNSCRHRVQIRLDKIT